MKREGMRPLKGQIFPYQQKMTPVWRVGVPILTFILALCIAALLSIDDIDTRPRQGTTVLDD